MAKRPSYVSVRARQRTILEYLAATGKTFKQAAKDFGVKPRELEKFALSKPTREREQFNRSPVLRKLYYEAERPRLARYTRTQGTTLRRIKFEPAELQVLRGTPGLRETSTNELQIGEMIQNLYRPPEQVTPQFLWAVYTREHGIPDSIRTLRLLGRNKRISASEYRDAITVWGNIYNIGGSKYDYYANVN